MVRRALRSISKEMKYLSTRNTFRRLIGKDRHAKVTKRTQQDLAQAVNIFEVGSSIFLI